MTDILDILIYILMGGVTLILAAGIFALFKGGEFGRSWSNKLMRARVLFQFVIILLLVVGYWAKGAFFSGGV